MKKLTLTLLLLIYLVRSQAQESNTLTLDQCYQLAEQNYPLIKQRALIGLSKEYSLANAAKGYLPQVSINGQASYQSEVTKIPVKIPGNDIPVLSKDQYRAYGELTQVLTDGGMIRQQKQMLATNAEVEEDKLDVDLYKIRDRINQLYFGVLLVDQQLAQNELLKNDINAGIRKAEALIKNGTAYISSADVVRAELLKVNQHVAELHSSRRGYLSMLSLFINDKLSASIIFIMPELPNINDDVQRPELSLYASQLKNIEIQHGIINAKNKPRLSLFFQGGIGHPALNMLSNKFETYYIGGARLSWSISGFYTAKKESAIVDINLKSIDIQKETFLFNTNFAVRQQSEEIVKYEELLRTDDDIINLRASIKSAASAQFENGVITSTDYLREVNAEDQAKQNKMLHQVQLRLAYYNKMITVGNR